MRKGAISQLVWETIQQAVDKEDLYLVDVDFKKEGRRWYLRVYIDKEKGVTVEDCQKISNQIEDLIEIEPPTDVEETKYPFVNLDWSRKWPSEEAWIVRKT